ncbi:TetR/AcrR family transcriptional regulator [Nonomuraea sp. NPDC050022]|uniref:TetR/AcrR family transcriptional regulator n=1 Tax=unclassified Nonomuraea TaxID=2593643 RepID=UPI0033FD3959
MDLPVVPFGRPRAERVDAARNRLQLLQVAREMIAEHGVERVTMDGLAERAGLGKGTVFRRFGTRAGIFQALVDEDDRAFQQAVMGGPPPLGPGADPVQRLIAYGRARIAFLLDHHAIVRAALDRNQPVPVGEHNLSRLHIRMLLGQAHQDELLDIADLDSLAVQLTAALEGPILLYLGMSRPFPADPTPASIPLADSWQTIIERLFRTPSHSG